LDPKVQQEVINSIKGLERTIIGRPGYAIEYDFSDPRDLTPSLESQKVRGLFFAGQINGTSGYEEAASQGIWAGVGAALRASGKEPIFLGRDKALMAVMFDDLTVYGVSEPYRMFSSRAEYRLSLREDNADLRLSPIAKKLGLLDKERIDLLEAKIKDMEKAEDILKKSRISPEAAINLAKENNAPEKDFALKSPVSAYELIKRPKVSACLLAMLIPELKDISSRALTTLETEIKFSGYLSRQQEEIDRLKKQESIRIPKSINYKEIPGLTREAIESLSSGKPSTLGQAGRMRGITPASLSALAVHIRKKQALGL
jgi:tRNA uridine 5-carboxymethylaminomethyl modification enzyme